MTVRKRLAIAVLTWAMHMASNAVAQTPTRAQTLFDEGHAAFDRGDLEQACDLFEQSQQLEPAGGTLMSLADCEERRGELLEARAHYHAALTFFVPPDPRIPFVNKRLSALDTQIPTLTLRLAPDAPPRASIELDGVPLLAGEIGAPVAVDPGEHVLVVSAPGHAARERRRNVAIAEHVELTLAPGPELVSRPPFPALSPVPPPPTTTESDYTAAFVLGAVTLATGIAGVALSVRTFTHYGDLAATCARQPGGCPDADRDAVAAEALTANVLYGVAGAAAVATLLSVVFAPSDEVEVSITPRAIGLRIAF